MLETWASLTHGPLSPTAQNRVLLAPASSTAFTFTDNPLSQAAEPGLSPYPALHGKKGKGPRFPNTGIAQNTSSAERSHLSAARADLGSHQTAATLTTLLAGSTQHGDSGAAALGPLPARPWERVLPAEWLWDVGHRQLAAQAARGQCGLQGNQSPVGNLGVSGNAVCAQVGQGLTSPPSPQVNETPPQVTGSGRRAACEVRVSPPSPSQLR